MVAIALVVVDCYDAPGLGQFWAAVLGTSVTHDFEEYVVVDGAPSLAFQTVPDPTPGKNRLHLDLTTADLIGETERILALGATFVERVEMRGGTWNVLADPEDNRFCLYEPFDLTAP